MYKQKARKSYEAKRNLNLPSMNASFRSYWDAAIVSALAKITELRQQGWAVDIDRGTFTKSQADKIAAKLEAQGNEVMRIPVSAWLDEEIQCLAYKPKPTPSPTAPSSLFDAFTKEWYPQQTPPTSNYLLDPDSVAIFVPYDATQLDKTWDEFVTHARKLPQATSPTEEITNSKDFRATLENEIDAFKHAHPDYPYCNISLSADSIVDSSVFTQSLRAFGSIGDKKIRIYAEEHAAHLFNDEGDLVSIAPIKDLNPPNQDMLSLKGVHEKVILI
jgi:hypothetical protein